MVLNFISLKMLKMLKLSPNPKRERTQLKMDLFAEGMHLHISNYLAAYSSDLTWTNNAKNTLNSPSNGALDLLLLPRERLRRFASSIWTLIAYRIDGNAATARHRV